MAIAPPPEGPRFPHNMAFRAAVKPAFLTLFLLLAPPAFATDTSILLRGKVVDKQESPVRGATVTITRVEEPNWTRVAKTDRKGRYDFFLLKGEKPLIALVEKEGYQSTRGYVKPVVLTSEQGSGTSGAREAESTFEVDFRLRHVEPTAEELATGAVDEDIRIIASQKAYNRGVSAARAGKLEKAVREFELAILADPRHRSAPFAIGKIRFDQKRYDEAAEVFMPLCESPRADAELLELTFHSLKNDSQVGDALPFLDRLWQLEPLRAHDELLEMATVYDNAGDFATARELVEKLLKTDPSNSTGTYVYGRLLSKMDEPRAAVEQLEKFLELAPDAAEAEPVKEQLEALRERARLQEAEAAG